MVNNKKSEKPTSTSYNATKTNTLANVSNEGSGDPFCNNCKSSGKYTYRKYRNPRPIKHYRLSYNDEINGVAYKKGRGATTVSSMERPGGLTRDTTDSSNSYNSSCCGQTVNTESNLNNRCCDTKVHITRSANTSIPLVKNKRVMSNRERLRQRGLTYKQNQTKNDNIENCQCSSKKTTDQMSNKKYYVQGAVDSGTRMAQLKFNTFNTTNKVIVSSDPYSKNIDVKHKFRGDYKERNENEQFHVVESTRKYNWGTNFCCPEQTVRPTPPTSPVPEFV